MLGPHKDTLESLVLYVCFIDEQDPSGWSSTFTVLANSFKLSKFRFVTLLEGTSQVMRTTGAPHRFKGTDEIRSALRRLAVDRKLFHIDDPNA